VSEVFVGTVDVVERRQPDEIIMMAHAAPGGAVGGLETVGTNFLIIRLNANTGEIICGGDSRTGTIRLLNGLLQETVTLDAQFSNLRLGGNGSDGDILLFAGAGNRNDTAAATIHLDGEAGDILFRNGDCAEEFDFADPDSVRAGSVVSLANDGRLHLAQHPYDRRVAGIVSGGGDTRPGIILGRDPTRSSRRPVALAGRVSCWVDADYAPVEVGDLLTTSATPGHAMRASDPTQAFGSVIGKAMGSLPAGAGLVPVLVALQ
jgi:hypothetical protein